MAKKPVEDTLIKIEQTQAALRLGIEKGKDLAEDSDRLIRLHKAGIENKPENPAQ